MSGWEIAILIFVCLAFVVAVGVIVRNKIKGKSCCGDCGGCNGCGAKNKGDAQNYCPHCTRHAKSETKNKRL
ncbi:MAG: hypothetical protein J1F69_00655 [Clostridiales bacterium]|nr:hypothetical protein [Clostridiales bacterium]